MKPTRLTPAEERRIKAAVLAKVPVKHIAKLFKIAAERVKQIVRGK